MSKEQLLYLERSAFICAIFYAPWYLHSYKAEHAVNNDYLASKSSYCIQQGFDMTIGSSLIFFQQHSWYLGSKVVVLILAIPEFPD
ncbi:MAG: hypothetical protein GY696_36890 [Gammaproteobacteria bacterium]|nr:hypothetical protein [Gammaproteobacteria bacterium]